MRMLSWEFKCKLLPFNRYCYNYASLSLLSTNACLNGHQSFGNLIFEHDQFNFSADKNGRTPLHLAAFADITDRRMLIALLPNESSISSFSFDNLESLEDHNGRGVLDMAKLHHSAYHEWKNILSLED